MILAWKTENPINTCYNKSQSTMHKLKNIKSLTNHFLLVASVYHNLKAQKNLRRLLRHLMKHFLKDKFERFALMLNRHLF